MVGLSLDIVGVLGLGWWLVFLPPVRVRFTGPPIDPDYSGPDLLPETDPRQREVIRQRRMYRAAAALIVVGFVLQIVAVVGRELS